MKDNIRTALIRKYLSLRSMSVKELALSMHIGCSTLYHKLMSDQWTLQDTRKIFSILKFSADDRYEFFEDFIKK